jgi:hypothetical protein
MWGELVQAGANGARSTTTAFVVSASASVENAEKGYANAFEVWLVVESMNLHLLGDALRTVSIGIMRRIDGFEEGVYSFSVHGAASSSFRPAQEGVEKRLLTFGCGLLLLFLSSPLRWTLVVLFDENHHSSPVD